MGASLALAGVAGCAFQPPEKIVPYVRAPEEVVSGKPLFFATALTLGGYARGVLVESWSGRPTKIEGNPGHPASMGGTDVFLQASILSLYDPDRSQVVTRNGRVSTWDDFLNSVLAVRDAHKADGGAGLRILTEVITSPTLIARIRAVQAEFPKAKWVQYDPVGLESAREGARLAFGEPVEPIHRLAKADIIVALDDDLLGSGPGHLKDALDFASRREPDLSAKTDGMNRLYVVEPTPTPTGSLADHRLATPSRDVEAIARQIARGVGVEGVAEPAGALSDKASRLVEAVVADLKAHKGASLVTTGPGQPASVHAIVHGINQALGNIGQTVEFIAPVTQPGDRMADLRELVAEMNGGSVATILVLGGNPAYDAPVDLDFRRALAKVKTSIRLSDSEDETSSLCHWQIPETHPLETWGDALAFDGTATIMQPLIAPLHGGKSAIEVVHALATGLSGTGHDLVREYWQAKLAGPKFETVWNQSLRDGVVPGTASKPKPVTLKSLAGLPAPVAGDRGLELVFRPDPTIWDGRFANNGWLQELPKPITRITWDNAALISPATAAKLGLKVDALYGYADLIDLMVGGRKLRMAIWLTPGQANDTITIHLGYGRSKVGRVGTGAGFDANRLRTSTAPWSVSGLTIDKVGETYDIATVQHHNNMDGRELVRIGSLGEYREAPHFAQEKDHHISKEMTLFEEPLPQARREAGEGNAWGMVINLNTCIGCNACMIACQSENNIPVVGKDQVLKGREMHWLRIDRYFEGDSENPRIHSQPVPCMHCEKAPCEVVCPVAATTHSAEGLNEMTYNRCVGTRYCSNNCPYKVRRFNFLQYSDETTPTIKLLHNPDVTVRSRGVMEKCTYCVQRISAARIVAETENRRVGGNEVVTACQSSCPTKAITFGNLNDPAADVVKQKASPRNYALLAELNTRPRTTYLAKLTNPNPALNLKEG